MASTGTWRFDPIPGAPGDAPPYVYEVTVGSRRIDIRASVEEYRSFMMRGVLEAIVEQEVRCALGVAQKAGEP